MTFGKSGNDARFEALYRKHYRWVVGYVMRMGFSLEDARDVAQDVLLSVYTSMDRYRGDAERGYLEVAAHNAVANWLRAKDTHKRRGKTVSVDEVLGDLTVDASQESESIHAERQQRLYAGIERLPESLRVPLLLRLAGYEYSEIQQQLRISPDAVKTRLHEAKNRLKTMLKDDR